MMPSGSDPSLLGGVNSCELADEVRLSLYLTLIDPSYNTKESLLSDTLTSESKDKKDAPFLTLSKV